MADYARIENDMVAEIKAMRDDFNPQDVAHKFDWRPVTDMADDSHDPATQVLEIKFDIFADRVERKKAARMMTVDEQKGYDDKQSFDAETQALQPLIDSRAPIVLTDLERLVRHLWKATF